MSDGFKVADAYADFHVDVDKGLDEAAARIRARGNDISKLGQTAGEGYSRGFKTGANPRSAMSDQISVIKSSRAAFTNEGKQAGASFAKGFGSPKLTTGGVNAGGMGQAGEKAGEELGKGVGRGYERSSKDVEKATEKVAKRTQAQFQALQFVGAFAGLPAAAAIGAAGVGVAFAGVPLLFAGVAAMALKSNEQVASSFTNLKTHVVADTQAMAAPMAGPLAAAAGDLGKSFDRLKPQISAAMVGSVPSVKLLTGAVTDFAENAMPGMIVAIKNSTAPLEGLKSLTGQAGAGLTDMFTNAAAGSQGAKTGMIQLGGVTRDLLGFTGSLLAEFANGSAGVLPQFRATLGQVEGTVLSLAHNGMPAMQGATSGFLGVTGGLISVIGGVAQGLGSWAQPLGSATGAMFATNSVAKLFGTSLGQTGFGLRAFASSTDAAGKTTTPFGKALDGAKGAGDKFKAGLGSVVSGGVNPLGIALIAGGFLLDTFGQAQQKASEAAAAHRENVRSLTDALRADNGVVGQHSAAVNVDALVSKNASANLATYGGTMELAKMAIVGNTGATAALTNKSNDWIATTGKAAGLNATQIAGLQKINGELLTNGGSYDTVRSKVDQLSSTQISAGKAGSVAVNALTDAQKTHLHSLLDGNGAVGEQVKAQREAQDAYQLSESALTGLTTAQVAARDATVAHTTALYNEQNALLAQRGAVLNTADAQDKYTKVMADGKATQQDKLKATLDLERAFAAQEQATYNAAFASSKASSDQGKQADATRAMNAETVKLAATFKGTLPQSIAETIGKFDAAEASAAGLKTGVNNLGQAVYILPNGKQIVISGDTKQARDAINALPAFADGVKGTVVIGANTDPATGKTRAAVQYADGSRGTITIDGNKDPATGKTMVAVQYANGQRSFMTIDAFNQAARDRTLEAKRNADGTVAWIIVNANTGGANAAINDAARDRWATINVRTVQTGPQANPNGRASMSATGGLITHDGVQHRGFANGGLVHGYATGGVTDVTPGGLLSGPGGPRGDKIPALVSDKEFVVNAASTARNLEALIYANRGGTIAPVPAKASTGASISAGPSTAPAPQAAPTINHYNTFHIQDVDVYTLATRVSRELSLRSRTGASM